MVDIVKISTFVQSSAHPRGWQPKTRIVPIVDIACLILDIQLPGIVGVERQGQLRNGATLPIVLVTANAMDANRERALKMGAKGYLSKPVRCQDLLNAVRAAISFMSERSAFRHCFRKDLQTTQR
jgi:FixJ family two-component response regulator